MNDKVIIITGGAKGIGKEIAIHFAQAGFSVMIADRDNAAADSCVNEITAVGGKAAYCNTDISVPSDIVNLMKETEILFAGIDVLINNAGYGIWKHPCELQVEDWDSVINTNLRGAFLCSREATPYIKKRGGGTIINIASTRALMSEPNSEAYAASKGGIVALTHSLAASLAPDRIRVNCISPGWIETKDYSVLKPSDHSQHFSGRVGKPSDIAGACMFLVKSDFINGENLVIDGGMTRKMIYEP